jgi:hypothetical protein
MNTTDTDINLDAPASLALIFVGSLPSADRKPDEYSYAFPLAYFPGSSPFPEDSVQASTKPVEIFNFNNVTQYDISSSSTGDTNLIFVDYRSVYSNLYASTGNPVTGMLLPLQDDSTYTTFQPASAITLFRIADDATRRWFPIIKNGLVYRDTTLSSSDTTSWLWSIPGATGGTAFRLFYTLPYPAIWFNYDDAGEHTITSEQKRVVRVKNAEGVHISNGDIVIDSTNIYSIERLVEISNQGERVLYSGASITGEYTSTTFSITFWDGVRGAFRILPAPAEGAQLIVDYTKESSYVEYRGYWNESQGVWHGLDLNPSPQRTYSDGITLSAGVPTEKPTEELVYRPVILYLLPTAAIKLDIDGNPELPIKYYSAYKEGGKDGRWHPLRHFVPEDPPGVSSSGLTSQNIASWGYAVLNVAKYAAETEFSAADRGIPNNQESALLVSRIRVKPKPVNQVEDARRFSGLPGNYDRKAFTGEGTDPTTNRWDTSPWEGVAVPITSSVLVEVSEEVMEREGAERIREVVEKHLPPGVVAVIKQEE